MNRWMLMLAALCLIPAAASGAGRQLTPLDCKTGPILKTYGGTPWRVYSCSDGKSIAVAAASGSPAGPFIFLFTHVADGYDLSGQGAGKRSATDAAYADLQKLKAKDITALIAETKKK
jgi:hypothetical protein